MDATKIVIVVLIVLGVLFFVGVGIGAGQGAAQKPSPTPPAWVESLKRALVFEQKLTPDDITSAAPQGCRSGTQFVVAANGTCVLQIGPLDSLLPRVRKMAFRLDVGSSAAVQLTLNDALTNTKTAAAGQTTETMDVFRDGATVTLVCTGVTPCRLQLN